MFKFHLIFFYSSHSYILSNRTTLDSNVNIYLWHEWHHQLNGHEFEQALGDGDGQGSLVCCSQWDKEIDTTE